MLNVYYVGLYLGLYFIYNADKGFDLTEGPKPQCKRKKAQTNIQNKSVLVVINSILS